MIAPRFRIRTILAIMAGLAMFFLLVGMGLRGHLWPAAVAIAVGSLGLSGVVYAGFFAALGSLAKWYEQQQAAGRSPVKVVAVEPVATSDAPPAATTGPDQA